MASNWTGGLYHLDVERTGWNSFGDSLHHTCMINAAKFLGGDFANTSSIGDFLIEAQSATLVRYPHKPGWWESPETVTRDQTMAFVIAAWIFDGFECECRELFYNLVSEGFRFPNSRRNVTLEVKPFWERDIPAYDTFGLFYLATGLWYLKPFYWLMLWLLPLEALINALNHKSSDFVKFFIKTAGMEKHKNSWSAKLALFIFINIRTNDDYIAGKGQGHPIYDVFRTYWQPEAGHDPKVFEETFRPLLEGWIKRASVRGPVIT